MDSPRQKHGPRECGESAREHTRDVQRRRWPRSISGLILPRPTDSPNMAKTKQRRRSEARERGRRRVRDRAAGGGRSDGGEFKSDCRAAEVARGERQIEEEGKGRRRGRGRRRRGRRRRGKESRYAWSVTPCLRSMMMMMAVVMMMMMLRC